MVEFAEEHGLHYTRYADDLTFSTSERIPSGLVDMVAQVVSKYGFAINAKKTKFMGRGDRMEVTGVVINERPKLPREWRNWARGLLHRASRNPEDFKSQWQRISGIYGSLKAFDPEEELRLTQKARETLNLVRPSSK
ncbi:reverse transcriptase domain-containing protein [Hoeflea sp.]|uniref:reverse transcriptase domain-containing protein n=1 Tax=Hoeflea sp. TaxID=1940281 RepID=UPI003B014810